MAVVFPGGCEAIVIRTGDKTVMGRIAQLTTGVGSEETPIGVEIKHCVKIITNLALIMGGIYIIVAFSLGVGWLDVITLSIGLMVGNMPGGLLIMVTVSKQALYSPTKGSFSKNQIFSFAKDLFFEFDFLNLYFFSLFCYVRCIFFHGLLL